MENSARDLREGLVRILKSDRLDEFCASDGIVALAHSLGVRIVMHFGVGQRERHALLHFAAPSPEISLFRSASPRRPIEVAPTDERRLKSHERFSIAHELGHWIAYKRLGIAPLNVAERSSEYWKHEGAINDFVGYLLVPERGLSIKLEEWKSDTHLPVQFVERFAKTLGVSRITLSRRIAAIRPDFAYLELQFNQDDKHRRLLLVVRESASGGGFVVPAPATKIRNDRLVEVLTGGNRGRKYMPSTSFDGKLIQSLYLSWSQIPGVLGKGSSGDAAWVGRLAMTNWSLKDVHEPFMDSLD